MPCSQWFLGSLLPSAPATGCAKNTLPRHEMPLPCELLPQGPSGAAAPGSCSFRVPVHPGRGLGAGGARGPHVCQGWALWRHPSGGSALSLWLAEDTSSPSRRAATM